MDTSVELIYELSFLMRWAISMYILILLLIFLIGRGLQVPPIYSVDSTNVEKWDEDVRLPAIEVVDASIKVR